MEEEIWKDIGGYDHPYQVSNLGRVKCLATSFVRNRNGIIEVVHRKERVLHPSVRNGYLCVTLTKNGAPIHPTVHRLVAFVFLHNPQSYDQVNHKNEIKTDNRVENLEWCNCLYNVNYGTAIQRRAEKMKGNQRRNKKCYLIDNGEKVLFDSAKSMAEYFGIDKDYMRKLLRREKQKGKDALFGYCD